MPARHRVDPIRTHPVPKRGGGLRLLGEVSPRDARVWDGLARRVAPLVERCLSPSVMAERLVAGGGGWSSRPNGLALRTARGEASRLADRIEVVSTDVRACYGSIRPDAVALALSHVGADPDDAALAADMAEGWGSEGHAGLPIGPRGSAVVANAVLLRVDGELSGVPFLRWVDDYLLPGRLLDRLDEGLHRVGLARSIEKTAPGLAGLWNGAPAPYDTYSWRRRSSLARFASSLPRRASSDDRARSKLATSLRES